jgi:6-phosphogluconolactonase (cycloisomerase 2 family)
MHVAKPPRLAGCFILTMALSLVAGQPPALAQSMGPAIFVSNNGNLEGSVTAFRVNPDGTLDFANKVVTGVREVTTDPCAGCNAYDISITPDGRHLATCHPAGSLDGVTILRVNSDATITQTFQLALGALQGGPLDVAWLNNEYLALARLDTNPDQVVVYRYDSAGPGGPTLTFINATPTTGNGMGYFAVHPNPEVPVLYVNDSGQKVVRAYSVAPNGSLALIDTESSGAPFPLEIAISRDGTKMYAAGGISNGGNSVAGFAIAPDGTLTLMGNSPFISQGVSPSNVYCSDDNGYLVVGHGTDATMHTMSIDGTPGGGTLTSTGFFFDVGGQGTLGDVHSRGGFAFVTDNSTATDGLTGVYSFTLNANGSLTMNGGSIYSTQGIAPRSIASWFPPGARPCPADIEGGNGIVNMDDLLLALNSWGSCPTPCPPSCTADVDSDCDVDLDDLLTIIRAWGDCP